MTPERQLGEIYWLIIVNRVYEPLSGDSGLIVHRNLDVVVAGVTSDGEVIALQSNGHRSCGQSTLLQLLNLTGSDACCFSCILPTIHLASTH